MTREEIKNTPEIVDFMLDKSVIADSREKLRKRLEEVCNLAIKALEQEPKTDTWSIKDVANTFKKHGLIREQEPCEDYVSRQAVLNEIYNTDGISNIYFRLADKIMALPPVTAEKVGQWIKTIGENGVTSAVRCSECGFEDNRYMMFRYCPTCGAKMQEVEE